MKNIFLLIFLVAIFSCYKKTSVRPDGTNATIIGFSSEKCGCCWGWKIKLDKEIYSRPDIYPARDYYIADKFPDGFSLPTDAVYPIRVNIEYTFDTNQCHYSMIKISKIAIPMDDIR